MVQKYKRIVCIGIVIQVDLADLFRMRESVWYNSKLAFDNQVYTKDELVKYYSSMRMEININNENTYKTK